MFCKIISANKIYIRYKLSLYIVKYTRFCCLIVAIILLTISRLIVRFQQLEPNCINYENTNYIRLKLDLIRYNFRVGL